MFRNYSAVKPADREETALDTSRMQQFFRACGRVFFLLFCVLLSAGLLYGSFPKPGHSVLAWFALLPFIWGVTKIQGFWKSFFFGWLTSLLFHAASLYWVYYTCLHGGDLSQVLSVAAWLGLSGLLALQMAFFGGSCYFLKRTGVFFPLLAACGWVALEWLHQTIAVYGLGFPWFMLGGTQWNFPQTLQFVSLTGVYGLSFVLAFTGTQLGWMMNNLSVKRFVGSWLVVAAIFWSVYGFGQYRLAHFDKAARHQSLLSVQAALMQPNIDQYKKWDDAFEQEIVDTITQLADRISPEQTLLTVWPESVSPGPLTEEKYANLSAI